MTDSMPDCAAIASVLAAHQAQDSCQTAHGYGRVDRAEQPGADTEREHHGGRFAAGHRRVADDAFCPCAHIIQIADGREIEIDLLVLATGFHTHNYMRAVQLQGRDGISIDDAWSKGRRAYGMTAMLTRTDDRNYHLQKGGGL